MRGQAAKKVAIWGIRATVVLLPVWAVLLTFYPPARLLLLAAVGRAPGCPLRNAMRSYEHQQLQTKIMNRIYRETRVMEKDSAGFTLLKTPAGPYWVPPGNEEVAGLLAEQELEVYGSGAFMRATSCWIAGRMSGSTHRRR
jgi:hypothetical protein